MTDAAPDPRARARRRALLAAAVLLGLFVLNGAWIARSLRALGGGRAGTGEPAPAFRGATLAGPPVVLADLRGRVVLLDFWATWCAPCMAQLPALKRLDERLGSRGLAVVGINVEGAAARRAVEDVVREAGLGYPTVLDEGELQQRYAADALPHLVLIDREGIVRRVFRRGESEAEIARAVEETLSLVSRP